MWARRRPAIAALVCLVALVSTVGFRRQRRAVEAGGAGQGLARREESGAGRQGHGARPQGRRTPPIGLPDEDRPGRSGDRREQPRPRRPGPRRVPGRPARLGVGPPEAGAARERADGLRRRPAGDTYLAYSPDGRRIATAGPGARSSSAMRPRWRAVQTLSGHTKRGRLDGVQRRRRAARLVEPRLHGEGLGHGDGARGPDHSGVAAGLRGGIVTFSPDGQSDRRRRLGRRTDQDRAASGFTTP